MNNNRNPQPSTAPRPNPLFPNLPPIEPALAPATAVYIARALVRLEEKRKVFEQASHHTALQLLDELLRMINQPAASPADLERELTNFLLRHQLFRSISGMERIGYLRELLDWGGPVNTGFWAWMMPGLTFWVHTTRLGRYYNKARDGNWFAWWQARGRAIHKHLLGGTAEDDFTAHMSEYEAVRRQPVPEEVESISGNGTQTLPPISEILRLNLNDPTENA
ncbi:uncharacterized protein F4822DRAFT_414237 [Hypoxylon trugodes]|uniref:uncharacterized protein n=1 Tax=Hypoxylon trugodes TaxID=326681 RepID=UPI0021A14C54|nr:uncharacterized protein F4822DRAFT_414237 [Hypoxylon trugodes]KAI1385818.1 hypothetical protein F4822DRAFT_414237 [Hypoxylon trugodes]